MLDGNFGLTLHARMPLMRAILWMRMAPMILSFPLLTFEVMVDHPDRLYLLLKRGGTSLQVTEPNYGLSPAQK
jgi:hypothetical protein